MKRAFVVMVCLVLMLFTVPAFALQLGVTSFRDMVSPTQWTDSVIPSYVFTGDDNGMTSIVGGSTQPLLRWMNDKGVYTISAIRFGGGVQTYAVSGKQVTGAVAFSPIQFHNEMVTPWVTYTPANKAYGVGINVSVVGVARESWDGAVKVADWVGITKFLGGGQ